MDFCKQTRENVNFTDRGTVYVKCRAGCDGNFGCTGWAGHNWEQADRNYVRIPGHERERHVAVAGIAYHELAPRSFGNEEPTTDEGGGRDWAMHTVND